MGEKRDRKREEGMSEEGREGGRENKIDSSGGFRGVGGSQRPLGNRLPNPHSQPPPVGAEL